MACTTVKAVAHSSSANLGPGFDVLALALDLFWDEIEVRACTGRRVSEVRLDRVSGPYGEDVSRARDRNTAVRAVEALVKGEKISGVSIELRVTKGVPPGRGLGSSGASAAGAVAAASRAIGLDLEVEKLIMYAGMGERAVAGTPHYDNVAASLLGGLVAVARDVNGRFRAYSLGLDAWFSVVIPMNEVPEGKTGVMRRVLPSTIGLGDAVRNFGRAAVMVAAAARGDLETFGVLMSSDEIVEPRRSRFVPCYSEVRRSAFKSGALGFALSGAGPSMIALSRSREEAERILGAMRAACTCCEKPLGGVARPAPGVIAEEVG